MTSVFAHPTLPDTFDRGPLKPQFTRVLFPEGTILQGADLNEVQTQISSRGQRVANLISRDGDRIEGADIIVNTLTGAVTLTSGKVFVKGDVRQVAGAILTGVSMVGEVSIGVRLTSSIVTHVEDPDLKGLMAGSEAEGEPGAAREVETVAWGRSGDGGTGDLYKVYLLKDGVAIDQTPPPNLSGVNAAIALYDRGAHGHYVVRGCQVSPLGLSAGAQLFSIGAGEANILGFKRTREFDLRHTEPETAETEEVEAEPRTYVSGASYTFTPYHTPIATVLGVSVEKEKTVTVTKGALTGSLDSLPDTSVISLIEVKQGGTTYVASTDYVLNADKVDWTPVGAEPAGGSSYTVKYRYYDTVPLGSGYSFTPDRITVNGGVAEGSAILRYTFKLPRKDILCLDQSGLSVYVKGLPARENPVAPITPTDLLKLAEISNDWKGTPKVKNAGIRSVPYEELWRYLQFLFDSRDLLNLERLKSGIDRREPVLKKGSFVDPFVSDYYRDAGVVQTAAIFDGAMQLAIDPTIYPIPLTAPLMLDWTHEVVLQQTLYSFCMPVNPYAVTDPLPGEIDLSPSSDFWTEFQTTWLSDVTREITGGFGGSSVEVVETPDSTRPLEFLRQIAVAFTIRGFLPNEQLATLTFDGVNVKPAGTQTANAQGVITNSFIIPPMIAAGVKRVEATGSADSAAQSLFQGQGTLDVTTRRRITTIVRPTLGINPLQVGPGAGRQNIDPLAQPFILTEGRFISAIDVKFCAKGSAANAVYVEIVTVRDGTPTTEVLAQCILDVTPVILNAWTRCVFPMPFWLQDGIEVAVVLKTDDTLHAVQTADLGSVDIVSGERIAAMPFVFGPLHSSSNARSWTAHQTRRMTLRVVAAKFAPVTKTYNFGNLSVADMSDILIAAAVELPTADAKLYFEIERQSGEIIKIAPGQSMPFDEYITESLPFRAVLSGTEKVSPVLHRELQVIAGKIRAQGTYVTRALALGTAIRLAATFKALLPSGSTLNVECDATNDIWTALTETASVALDLGFLEKTYTKTPYTAVQGRLRMTFTGGPAARPRFEDMTAVVV